MTLTTRNPFMPRPVRSFIHTLTDRLAAIGPRRLAPRHRESRRALHRRQNLVRYLCRELGHAEWQVVIPRRVNAPAFLVTPQGRYRILIRTMRSGVDFMGLTLSHALTADDLGYVVVWLDQLWSCTHAVVIPAAEAKLYHRFTIAQIIACAVRSFHIPA
ncbi:hypothetical protein HNQ07_004581 [Deinococcus metalli]|uniref:Uncharacterized protein n=1 Tax=Deinococcus metalli TaxID=1141878 RepID=A0A7W8NRK5_9DEIO|nr:hypothetical protein [Deinococcus metalli]MBB5379071.1 hypothetical protein [Deinococcus metalli]GHF64022.1 hypothetical protein GCM10017781_44960 [Deinococcus metalli]